MATTYNPVQTASCILQTVDTTTSSLPVSDSPRVSALYRFQIPAVETYFVSTLVLDVTITGTFGGFSGATKETYHVLILKSPIAHTTLTIGALDVSLVPDLAFSAGTAPYYILATKTITQYGAVSFDLDLAPITNIMSSTISNTNKWTGSLLLWVVAATAQESLLNGFSTSPTMTVYDTIEYPNRDTGSRGINSSRWTRCPVSGLKIPRGEMVLDGYRGMLVAPDSYDPPEPEARDWEDIAEENEDA